jgi:hypothetical protein
MSFGSGGLRTRVTQYVNGADFDGAETFDRRIATGVAPLTANQMYVAKVRFPRVMTIANMLAYIGTQSGNLDMGIFDCAVAGPHTTASVLRWLASTGSVAAGAGGAVQVAALTAPLTVRPDKDYWLAIAADNATVTFARIGPIAAMMTYDLRTGTKATSFPLPTTTVTTFGSGSNTPWVGAAA